MFRRGTIFFVLFALGAAPALALPRYAARYGQNCNLCHQNPTGGGQRSAYAAQYLVPAEMVAFPLGAEEMGRIDPALGANVSVGADLRTQFMNDLEGDGLSNFFQMQGDLYVTLTVDDRNLVYFDQGISEKSELFGLSYILPWQGYVKVGRFTPAYGWKFADHNRFVRDVLGLAPPAHTDVGVELGAFPGRSAIQVAVMNGAPGSRLDIDETISFVGRAAHRYGLGPIGLTAGASVRWIEDATGQRRSGGPFGALAWGRFTWLGELDAVRSESPGDGGFTTAVVSTQEIGFQLHPGVDLVAVYDQHDPDVDWKTGRRSGFSLGLEFFPHPFFQLQTLVRSWRQDGASDRTQAIVQAHFLY